LPLVVTVVIGTGTWQVLTTKAQLRDTRQELEALNYQLVQARPTAKKAESALAIAQRSADSRGVTITTMQPRAVPFPFVDTLTLLADLRIVYSQATGLLFSAANAAWVNKFINAFTTEELRETALAEMVGPISSPIRSRSQCLRHEWKAPLNQDVRTGRRFVQS
jgi:hypothetical protein